MLPSRPALLALLPGAALIAACQHLPNDRLTIGSADAEGAGGLTIGAFSGATPASPDRTPSLTGIDRSGQAAAPIVVPVDRVIHRPAYRLGDPPLLASATARQRGEHPTAFDSVELGGDAGAQQVEAAFAPLFAAWEVLTLPIRAAVDPPWSTHEPPIERYERYREDSGATVPPEPMIRLEGRARPPGDSPHHAPAPDRPIAQR